MLDHGIANAGSASCGVDVLYMFILRDPIGSFSDWQRYDPARAHSGAPLYDQYDLTCYEV